jgi:predicted RNA-binding Zn ribbon-like protein
MSGTTSAAPEGLETVRQFVNTRNVETEVEGLATPEDLRRWLRQASLLAAGADLREHDLRRALALREALRAAMAAHHADMPIPTDAVTLINEVAKRAQLSLAFTSDSRWTAEPRADGVDGALGALLALVAAAISDRTWGRLKVCLNDTCQWAFYDHSRARTGKWCSMQGCGNRAKQRAWRARHEDRDGVPTQQ